MPELYISKTVPQTKLDRAVWAVCRYNGFSGDLSGFNLDTGTWNHDDAHSEYLLALDFYRAILGQARGNPIADLYVQQLRDARSLAIEEGEF